MAADILSYGAFMLMIFVLNIVPAFAPPSWLMLSIYKINNPSQNVLVIVLLGVLASTAGRLVMYAYSYKLGRFIPKKYAHNTGDFRELAEKHRFGFFFGSFLFSLGPLPSNFLFISSGISRARILPVFAGFALGRLVSYSVLVYAAFATFGLLAHFNVDIKLLADLLSIAAAVSIIFVDWKNLESRSRLTNHD